ncbi:DNA mismatch repair endonuclease MutL [Pseudalkalibacillus hwajinpoensis]|uniref:DNA mismatch repair protein MutL n=1 Tax=Guptibacillus hwajinpoensis TaxID=208199 RepID=A0A4U1MLN2_9BACL|nr:DNA mismatch repair endonuclease MutL [Pseudalkalibacillus hwajinpoensis]TKD71611.1 DNA mismatch repair endonuclease MutL [Pseudalkalibacillus hwajinpoensis]
MGKIVQLDDQLSNKIAAGEVVERPASVVKELVENAIDAESSEISIEIEEGGLSKIRIVDNGSGMDEEDCKLAFFRHATSKIKNERDLFQIETLGFRGEALPSIAAVSHLELKTSTGDAAGTYVRIEAGKVAEFKATDSRKGTEMTITGLFYNTPARLKHMKTVHTELANVADVINRQAMAHPDIAFRFFHNGKKLLSTTGNGDLLQVIAAIYGYNTARKMLPLHAETIDFTVTGYAAKPELTRASRQYISLVINGRYIKNFTISKGIQQGYHTLLPIGRYPIVVLHIKMNPTLIDVNVHPSKLEARISKEQDLALAIENAIKGIFKRIELIPEQTLPKKKEPESEQPAFQFQHDRSKVREEAPVQEVKEPEFKTVHSEETAPVTRDFNEPFIVKEELKSDDYETNQSEPETRDELEMAMDYVKETNDSETRIPPLYPIGQMHGTYILAQNENGLYIIDQHAAQERIKYEFYREKVGEIDPVVQELLVPFTLEYNTSESAIIDSRIDDLAKVGVFLESFGRNSYMVSAHPVWFPKGAEQNTIEELIQEVVDNRAIDVKKLREEAAIMMSCKKSIKANRHLRDDEVFTLLETLRQSIDPYTCPHGRPIIIHYSTYEMEKMFKRVM